MGSTPQPYSQSRALWAITKASFKAIFANPSAIIFSILFPLIFIMIFGAFGDGAGVSVKVGFDENSDTTNQLYGIINDINGITVSKKSQNELIENLKRGKITALINIKRSADSIPGVNAAVPYIIYIKTSDAVSPQDVRVLKTILDGVIKGLNKKVYPNTPEVAIINDKVEKIEGRPYRRIDFILPGQLGFSILFSTLFGIAFAFFVLREQLVLKRFYASPVNKINILLGIGMSRLFFQLMNVIVLILVGHFFMNFTLQHGIVTVIDMLLMTIVMLFLLMGVGLIFSSIAKSDTNIPLLINLFGFPQMMLSGTFFPIEVFPKWLQEICRILPLTQFNDSMRKIAFEGQGIFDCWREIGILGIWMVIIYAIAIKVLKWE